MTMRMRVPGGRDELRQKAGVVSQWGTVPEARPKSCVLIVKHLALLTRHCHEQTLTFLPSFSSLYSEFLGSRFPRDAVASLLHPVEPSSATCKTKMAPPSPTKTTRRPYRVYLSAALHRRFIRATFFALLICYVEAILIGSSRSCTSRSDAPRLRALPPSP